MITLAFFFTEKSQGIKKVTGLGKKKCTCSPSLGLRHVNLKESENDVESLTETMFSYIDRYLQEFERQPFEGDKVGTFNQKV